MMINLRSYFSQYLTEMMALKRNSGFSLSYMDSHVIEFDAFCCKSFPEKQILDRELVESWIYDTSSESERELNKRIRTMRHLANHLMMLGMPAYLYPKRIKIPKSPEPHIFTDEQLTEFFRVCDSFEPKLLCYHATL